MLINCIRAFARTFSQAPFSQLLATPYLGVPIWKVRSTSSLFHHPLGLTLSTDGTKLVYCRLAIPCPLASLCSSKAAAQPRSSARCLAAYLPLRLPRQDGWPNRCDGPAPERRKRMPGVSFCAPPDRSNRPHKFLHKHALGQRCSRHLYPVRRRFRPFIRTIASRNTHLPQLP